MNNNELICEDEARGLVSQYLRRRYYDFEKIKFVSCELTGIDNRINYRFHGVVFLKSRGIMERFVSNKVNNFYKFMFDINAETGEIVNYEFV